MCNEKRIKSTFYLNNNIQIAGTITNFKLLVNNNLILEHCTHFSFIENKLFVTKSGSKIYVFGTKVIHEGEKSSLEELAVLDIKSFKTPITIKIDQTTYNIDYNCKITYSDSSQ